MASEMRAMPEADSTRAASRISVEDGTISP
jgi:hypothetical protein